MGDSSVDDHVILKWILQEKGMRVGLGSVRPR
jgi:hypothetical protein